MVSLSSKEQARLCGVDLDVELELQKRWGAGPEEEATCVSESGVKENENTTMGDVVPSSASSAHASRVIFLDDERELEQRYGKDIVNGDGCFLPRSWVFAQNTEILFEPEAGSTCLHTFARNGGGESICHDKHPFVTIVHLLRNADDNSCVYISVPYLSDLHFVDELCHYAKSAVDGGKNLSIRVVLGPEQWVKDRLNEYVNNPISETGRQLRENALRRLDVREWGTPRGFSHSKAMVTTAGAMIGSYNYTYAARFYHYEEGVFLAPDNNRQLESLRDRIEQLWNRSRPVITLARRPPPGYMEGSDSKRAKKAP